ncbi:MAG TPA: hypothetical protein PKE63_01795 [Lacibacter sp.]|nr:hypothetical protein [Lacibacter sp.]HMO88744.1 hypothetical protein [Lacibacter sp.]HMP85976.1 hypothetical protein [Lacibacter sp.]
MKKFLCCFRLPEVLADEFWEKIPRHRHHINQLMRDEVIVTYSVNQERSKGWVVLNAESLASAESIVGRFPIRRFIAYDLEELFIFDSMIGAPKMVLN